MNKLCLSIFVATSFLFACQRDSTSSDPGPSQTDKVAVKFDVSGFIHKIEQLPMENGRRLPVLGRDSTLSNKVSFLYYIAYQGNIVVSEIRQRASVGPNSFGIIRDSLPQGTYKIAIIASQDSIRVQSPQGLFGNFYDQSNLQLVNARNIYTNIFTHVVTAQPQAPLDLALTRKVGKIEVNILDAAAIESQNLDITVQTRPTNYNYSIHQDTVFVQYTDYYILKLARPDTTKWEGYMFSTPQTTVTIYTADKVTGRIRGTKAITGIPVSRNKKTILTGYLDSTANNSNLKWDVNLNENWDGDINVGF